MSKLSNFFDEIITSTEQGYATEPQTKEEDSEIVDVVPVQTYVEEAPMRLDDELKKEVKRQSEAIKRKEVLVSGKLR